MRLDWRQVYPVEQLLRPRFQIEPGVLMRLVAGDRRDALHEVEDALGLAAFFGEHCLDDLRCLRLAEAALAQEFGAFLVRARDDPLSCRLDAVDERHGRGIGKPRQRRRCLMGEA